MIKFIDGPAAGVELAVRYAPATLRAVRDITSGQWDALDAPRDEPTEMEEIFVYERVGVAVFAHIDSMEKGRRVARTLAVAEYRFAGSDQPPSSR